MESKILEIEISTQSMASLIQEMLIGLLIYDTYRLINKTDIILKNLGSIRIYKEKMTKEPFFNENILHIPLRTKIYLGEIKKRT